MGQYMYTTKAIAFNYIDIKRPNVSSKKTKDWVVEVIKLEGFELDSICITFCSDEFLLDLNNKSLGHNYYTDIITFQLNDSKEAIYGDIYISIDRVRENAKNLKLTMKQETKRVIIHGILHLCGYKDASNTEKKTMRNKEDYYLAL